MVLTAVDAMLCGAVHEGGEIHDRGLFQAHQTHSEPANRVSPRKRVRVLFGNRRRAQ
jgi:hypothetical protein